MHTQQPRPITRDRGILQFSPLRLQEFLRFGNALFNGRVLASFEVAELFFAGASGSAGLCLLDS